MVAIIGQIAMISILNSTGVRFVSSKTTTDPDRNQGPLCHQFIWSDLLVVHQVWHRIKRHHIGGGHQRAAFQH